MGKIVIEFKSSRSNTLEIKVRALIQELTGAESLSGARNHFNSDLRKIKTGNNGKAEFSYKMVAIDSSVLPPIGRQVKDGEPFDRLEVWKMNVQGDYVRLVAHITEVRNG
jgi:hypothetical protein